MNYSIEIPVYYMVDDIDLELHDLEVTFDLDFHGDRLTRYSINRITGYFINGSPVTLEEVKQENPWIERQINNALDHFVANYDENDEAHDYE